MKKRKGILVVEVLMYAIMVIIPMTVLILSNIHVNEQNKLNSYISSHGPNVEYGETTGVCLDSWTETKTSGTGGTFIPTKGGLIHTGGSRSYTTIYMSTVEFTVDGRLYNVNIKTPGRVAPNTEVELYYELVNPRNVGMQFTDIHDYSKSYPEYEESKK